MMFSIWIIFTPQLVSFYLEHIQQFTVLLNTGEDPVGNLLINEDILQCWEDWNPRKWEPAKNPDRSYADPVPLMYSAGSHPNEAWGGRGIETPTSMRSVDASCEAEVLTNRYTAKEGEDGIFK